MLVEGDPRRPAIAGLVGVESDVGLADVLAERPALDEAVHATHTYRPVGACFKSTPSARIGISALRCWRGR